MEIARSNSESEILRDSVHDLRDEMALMASAWELDWSSVVLKKILAAGVRCFSWRLN